MRYSFFLFLAGYLCAQPAPANRLTFSGGWSRQIGGYAIEHPTATGLGISYGFRAQKHIELEVGLFTALHPSPDLCYAYGCTEVDDRFFWVPFGVRLIEPLLNGRLELSAGGGGLHENYSLSNSASLPTGARSYSGWGGYFAGGAALALDRSRHWWLGATPRWFLANPQYGRDRWFQLSGELSFRF